MIIIVDYGVGNVASIRNMIRRVGGEAEISGDVTKLKEASALILPGVGAFDHAIERLDELGLRSILIDHTASGKSLMGICLGMQLLFETSEEGKRGGLGLIPGHVRRFSFSDLGTRLPIPHMGWNVVQPEPKEQMFSGLPSQPRFYFVHSYHAQCDDEYIAARCSYGYEFACAVRRGNIFGTQFHPEKSHKFGMDLFANYLRSVC